MAQASLRRRRRSMLCQSPMELQPLASGRARTRRVRVLPMRRTPHCYPPAVQPSAQRAFWCNACITKGGAPVVPMDESPMHSHGPEVAPEEDNEELQGGQEGAARALAFAQAAEATGLNGKGWRCHRCRHFWPNPLKGAGAADPKCPGCGSMLYTLDP